MIINTSSLQKYSPKKAYRIEISTEQKNMLKNSLLRILFYQNQKH